MKNYATNWLKHVQVMWNTRNRNESN